MSETHYVMDTTKFANGRQYITATRTDADGTSAMTAVVVWVYNPTTPEVALDIKSAPGTDPVELKYRAGETGKKTTVSLAAKFRGHVRVNGVVQP